MENTATTRRFKVISSIGEGKEFFVNMVFDFVLINEEIGADCNCLGGSFKITQNGKIFVLVNQDWCLTIQDITPIPEPIKPKLVINENVEIYLDTKEVEVKEKCTYTELYNLLVQEWSFIEELSAVKFPFVMRENNNLLLMDSWNLKGFSLVQEGSFERQNNQGRSI